jgi:hypothetical protein
MGFNFKDAWSTLWNGSKISLTDDRLPQSIKFFYNNGQLVWERTDGADAMKRIYETCAPVSSIIDNMADAFVSAEFEALNSRTENKVRGINKEWQKLLDKPNHFQDGKQFMKQLYTYRKMWGWCYVLKSSLVGFNIPSQLICLPPWLLDFEYTQSTDYMAKGARKVYLCLDGKRTLLDDKDLMLFTDVTNVYDEDVWLPRPRIYTKYTSLTLLISIIEAETALIQNKGALGIVSSGDKIEGMSVPMSEAAKDDIQRQFQSKYGLRRDQVQMIFTQGAVNYTPLVFDFNQLQLKETYLSAVKDMHDALHYPIELSAHSDRSTYNNVIQAETSLYQNAIIPDANSIMQQLTNQINADGVMFWANYEHVEALQRGKKEKADARKSINEAMRLEWDNGLITRNMWLEALEMDTVADEMFNKYKWQLTPEQLGQVQNTNNDASKNKGITA